MHVSISALLSIATAGIKLALWRRQRQRALIRKRIAMTIALVLALAGAMCLMWKLGNG